MSEKAVEMLLDKVTARLEDAFKQLLRTLPAPPVEAMCIVHRTDMHRVDFGRCFLCPKCNSAITIRPKTITLEQAIQKMRKAHGRP